MTEWVDKTIAQILEDTNYNSITLLWDWIFRTLQPLDDAEPVVYGITRDVDTGSFRDTHFGDFRLLWGDVRGADVETLVERSQVQRVFDIDHVWPGPFDRRRHCGHYFGLYACGCYCYRSAARWA